MTPMNRQPKHTRKAKAADIYSLGELAQAGFQSSPVYSFVRTRAHEYPEDTVKSYREELRVLAVDPRVRFTVLELDRDELEKHGHVTPSNRSSKKGHKSSWVSNLSLRTHKKDERRIIGFAIWRLNPNSNQINQSLMSNLKCIIPVI